MEQAFIEMSYNTAQSTNPHISRVVLNVRCSIITTEIPVSN